MNQVAWNAKSLESISIKSSMLLPLITIIIAPMSFFLPSFAKECSSYDHAKVLLTSSMSLDHTRGTEIMLILTEDSVIMKPKLFS